MASKYSLSATAQWLVCTACGTQFPTADRATLTTCFICDDPRQFTPPSGQSFTTLDDIRKAGHRNVFYPYGGSNSSSSSSRDEDGGGGGHPAVLTSIVTEPKLAIGQRAILVRTPAGNVLWDCLTLLDDETVERVRSLGGLGAIVISHPHYYSTHATWAAVFGCPVYLAVEDKRWTTLESPSQVFLGTAGGGGSSSKDDDAAAAAHEIMIAGQKSGFKAIRLGGHFPGSMVGLFAGRLLVADTFYTTPAGYGSWATDAAGVSRSRPPGINTFAFMYSIPNMIPLGPAEVGRMWERLRPHEFRSTHGAFAGQDVEDDDVAGAKGRVLESMQIQIRHMGWPDHPLLAESWPPRQ